MESLKSILLGEAVSFMGAENEGTGVILMPGRVMLLNGHSLNMSINSFLAIQSSDYSNFFSKFQKALDVGKVPNPLLGTITYATKSNYNKIDTVYVTESGYGTLLYKIVAKLSKTGFIRPDYEVSDSARKIWIKFYYDKYCEKRLMSEFYEMTGQRTLPKEFPTGDESFILFAPKTSDFSALVNEAEIQLEEIAENIIEKYKEKSKEEIVSDLKNYLKTLSTKEFSDYYDGGKRPK